mmetsp:Transcript_30725/g.95058  ORF Transcript_30725/g.95058 Transcript_30725/m.95058 type:complete len:105 (-) Transcript_30725:1812-2126(-)
MKPLKPCDSSPEFEIYLGVCCELQIAHPGSSVGCSSRSARLICQKVASESRKQVNKHWRVEYGSRTWDLGKLDAFASHPKWDISYSTSRPMLELEGRVQMEFLR